MRHHKDEYWIDLNYDDGKGVFISPEHYNIIPGWWRDKDGGTDWYLNKTAAIKELHGKKKFEQILKTKNVKTQIRENPKECAKYKTFTVYRALDLGIDRDPDLERNKRKRANW